MPAMDKHQFEKRVKKAGFTLGHGTKHPHVIAPDGDTHTYAVSHRKGAKDYVKPHYVDSVKQFIRDKGGTP